jgi:thiol-disulfide isomerase/thioredoxin
MKSNQFSLWIVALAVVVAGSALVLAQDTKSLAGKWDGTVTVSANNSGVIVPVEVPFPLEIASEGGKLKASFLNGSQRIASTASAVNGDTVVFTFGQYGATLNATVKDGALAGQYIRPKGRGAPLPFKAARAAAAASNVKAPSIDGVWIVQAKSNKGESAWRFIVDQKGPQVSATILRIDGDTGTLSGSFKDGKFVLGHFSGARPLLVEVTPNADGTLTISQNKQTGLLAAREAEAKAKSLGTPTDPALHTSMKDATEPFRFSFPNLKGEIESNTDPKFKGKVLLVNIAGSWCPNCHDETPFLVSLYKKYKAKGFEIVGLSFEEDEQQPGLARLKAFNENYGIDYTVLVPGNPDQLNEKVPQANNLNAFPTSFIVGRDGRVRAVHAGFPSPGSGEFYKEAEKEVTALVEKLLAERAPGTSR